MQINRVSPADWPALAASFRDLVFEQVQTYAEAAARRIGGTVQYYEVRNEQRLLAAAAVRIKRIPGLGRGIAWIASGPMVLPLDGSAPDDSTVGAILAAFRDQIAGREGHVLRLRLSGFSGQEATVVRAIAATAGLVPTDRSPVYQSIGIDLGRSPEAMMAGFGGNWRKHLRFALQAGLELQRGTGPALEARFLALLGAVQTAKGFSPTIPPDFHFPLQSADYLIETLIAVKDGQDVGGLVTGTAGGEAGPTATYLFAAATEAGRPFRAGYFLTWEALLLARERGQAWFDMGGIDPETNPGVARFKEHMNGRFLLAEPFQANPPGLAGHLILGAEALRTRMKKG